jgi:hypothetical protein
MIDFDYSGVPLSSGNYRVTDSDHHAAPAKEQTIIDIARRDGSVKVFDRLDSRSINLGGYITADDRLSLKGAMDTLKALLNVGTKTLRVTEEGEYREWQASLKNVVIKRSATDITRADYSLQFFSEDPYSTDGFTDTLVDENVTDSAAGFGFIVEGTYKGMPLITITINSIDPDDSDVNFIISNPATSQQFTITQTVEAGDVISIDTKTGLIFLNADSITGEGQIPQWIPGAGSIEYNDDASSSDVDILVVNDRRYL